MTQFEPGSRERKIRDTVLSVHLGLMLGGVPFEDAIIILRVALFLIEEIDRNPNIDEDFLGDMAERLVAQELRK